MKVRSCIMQVREELIAFVFDKSDLDDISEIPLDKSLLSEGILDSMGILELVEFIEEHWGLHIEDEDFGEEVFGSIERMELYISSKIQG